MSTNDVARLLIERGADVNAVGYKFGRRAETPLAVALRKGNEPVVAMLRAAGAQG